MSQLQQQYRLTEFGCCRGISVFTPNFVKFPGNTEIPQQRPNSAAQLEIPRLTEKFGPYPPVTVSNCTFTEILLTILALAIPDI